METEVISLLSKLEPILGITFALNLAYIGLPRFRYRENIRDYVRSRLDEMKDIPEQHCDTDWYKQVMRLSNLENHDGSAEAQSSGKMPSENWAFFYVKIFEKHRDRHLVCGAAFFCAVLLFLGVAHELSFLAFTKAPFVKGYIEWFFWVCAAMAALPVFFVLNGGWVVRRAKSFAEASIKNLKKTFQKQAQEAAIDGPLVVVVPTAQQPTAAAGH